MAESKASTAGQLAATDCFEGTPYRTIRRERSGGQGQVFVVEHRGTRRKLVAKLLHTHFTHDARLLHRLRIEAQSLGALDHAHIVRVVGFEKTRDDRPFIVMEHLNGRTLAEELAQRTRLPVIEAVTYAVQLLSALAAAHERGLVHRDIKPENLFICDQPNGSKLLKVLDFGLVRVLPERASIAPLPLPLQTNTGIVVGTPRFVSPEAALGERVDGRADIYAVGLVLYAMLAGRGPFDHVRNDPSVGAEAFLYAHASQTPPLPSEFAEEPIPAELEQAILIALAKEPSERFQTAVDFKNLLDQVLELLRCPSGWLQTTAFRAPRRIEDQVAIASGTRPDAAALEPQPETPAEQEPDKSIRDSIARPFERSPVMPTWFKTLVFLVGVTVAGVATLGAVMLIRG